MAASRFKNVFGAGGAGVSKRRSHEIGLPHTISSLKRLKSNPAHLGPVDHLASVLDDDRYGPELGNHWPPG